MQRPQNHPPLTAELSERERFPPFIYNFLFFPPDGLSEKWAEIDARLSRLRHRTEASAPH